MFVWGFGSLGYFFVGVGRCFTVFFVVVAGFFLFGRGFFLNLFRVWIFLLCGFEFVFVFFFCPWPFQHLSHSTDYDSNPSERITISSKGFGYLI